MFSDDDIEQLIQGTYKIDCARIRLTNRGEPSRVYEGSGNISFNEDEVLTATIYHVFDENAPKPFSHLNSAPVSGKLFVEDDYYSFEAISMSGRKWHSDNVLPNFGGIKIPSCGHVISVPLDKIFTISETQNYTFPQGLSIIKGSYSLPWKTYKNRNEHTVLCVFDGEGDHLKWEIEDFDKKYIKVEQIYKTEINSVDSFDIFLEGLSIVCGTYLNSLASIHVTNHQVTSTIYSHARRNIRKKSVASPFKLSLYGAQDCTLFLLNYCSKIKNVWEPFFVFWSRLASVNNLDFENACLVVGVAIESLMDEWHKGMAIRSSFDKQELTQLTEHIKAQLPYKSFLRGRLLNYLQQPQRLSIAKKLKNLKNYGVTVEMIEAWQSLRHKSTHGVRILDSELHHQDVQNVLDDFYRCLALFYKLLFLQIGYSGNHHDFSLSGWPYTSNPAPDL